MPKNKMMTSADLDQPEATTAVANAQTEGAQAEVLADEPAFEPAPAPPVPVTAAELAQDIQRLLDVCGDPPTTLGRIESLVSRVLRP